MTERPNINTWHSGLPPPHNYTALYQRVYAMTEYVFLII